MTEDNLFFEDNSENEENEEESFEPDPATIAHMDQETAAFREMEHEFEDRYGFVHKCNCDADYSSGNLVQVTECYANMIIESLDAAQRLNQENKLLRSMLTQIFAELANDRKETNESDSEVESGPEAD